MKLEDSEIVTLTTWSESGQGGRKCYQLNYAPTYTQISYAVI